MPLTVTPLEASCTQITTRTTQEGHFSNRDTHLAEQETQQEIRVAGSFPTPSQGTARLLIKAPVSLETQHLECGKLLTP